MSAVSSPAAPSSAICCARCWPRRSSSPSPAAGAISVRAEAAGTASGTMGFLQMGIGSLFSQFGAYLGGHFATPVALNLAIVVLSAACASTMIFLIPRRILLVSEELIEQAEEEESGML